MLDFHEAVKQMYKGHVVKFNAIDPENQTEFCMFRGCIFSIRKGSYVRGDIVYDPSYTYTLTNKTVNTDSWPIQYA